jgi:hypothetical protein
LQGDTTNKSPHFSIKNTNASGFDYTLRSLTDGNFELINYTTLTTILKIKSQYFQIRSSANSFLFGVESNTLPGLWIGVDAGSQTLTNSTLLKNGTDTILSSNSLVRFYNGTTDTGRIFATTGNWLIQTGGTFSDAGFKLDVNGTARVSGNLTIGASPATQNITIDTTSATQNIQLFKSGVYSSYLWVDSNFNHSSSAGGGTYLPFRGSAFIANSASLSEGIVNLTSGSVSNIVRFFATGVTEQGVIGYATGATTMQFRTNGATSISNGTLAMAIFKSTNVSIGDTTTEIASAQLSVTSTTKGFRPPVMTNAQRTAISSPAVGLIVYCTDAVEGLYVYKSTGWTFVI